MGLDISFLEDTQIGEEWKLSTNIKHYGSN